MSTAITLIAVPVAEAGGQADRPDASHVGAMSSAASVVAPNVDGDRAVMSERYPAAPTD